MAAQVAEELKSVTYATPGLLWRNAKSKTKTKVMQPQPSENSVCHGGAHLMTGVAGTPSLGSILALSDITSVVDQVLKTNHLSIDQFRPFNIHPPPPPNLPPQKKIWKGGHIVQTVEKSDTTQTQHKKSCLSLWSPPNDHQQAEWRSKQTTLLSIPFFSHAPPTPPPPPSPRFDPPNVVNMVQHA